MLNGVVETAPGSQRLVESLASRLGRPVVLDDVELRPLAHSPQQPDEADRVRTISILSREAPPEAVAYLRGHGVGPNGEGDPLRIPANEAIGLQARLCQPVIDGERTLGFLWIVEGGNALNAEDVELVADVAEAIAATLSRHGPRAEEAQLRAQVANLLRDDPAISCDAAASLLDAGAFPEATPTAALVGLAIPPAGELIDDTVPVLLSRGLHAFERELPPRQRLMLARGNQAIVLIGDEQQSRLEARAAEHAKSLREGLRTAAPGEDWSVAVGIGGVVKSLAGAPRSYTEAAQAAKVAARVPQVSDVLSWSEIGIYRLLVPANLPEGDEEVLPVPIRVLLARPANAMLLHTLETYLDHAGDAQATTAALFLARGSLYYRLRRIEELAGVNLRSGHDRLVLHLGLKLARIVGLYPLADVAPVPEEPQTASAA